MEDPQEKTLTRLAQLRALHQDDTPGLVKMLGELYGIQQEEQLTPAKKAALESEAKYHDALGNVLSDSRKSHSMEDEAHALYQLFPAGVPPHIQAQLAKKYGYDANPPATAKPMDVLGGDATAAPPSGPLAQRIGHAAGVLGRGVAAISPQTALPFWGTELYRNWPQVRAKIGPTIQDFWKGLTQ